MVNENYVSKVRPFFISNVEDIVTVNEKTLESPRPSVIQVSTQFSSVVTGKEIFTPHSFSRTTDYEQSWALSYVVI